MSEGFTIALHVGGEINYWDDVDPNRMSILVLWKVLKQVGYISYENVYYLVLGRTLDNGLMELKTDAQCLRMLGVIKGHDELHIYVEHLA